MNAGGMEICVHCLRAAIPLCAVGLPLLRVGLVTKARSPNCQKWWRKTGTQLYVPGPHSQLARWNQRRVRMRCFSNFNQRLKRVKYEHEQLKDWERLLEQCHGTNSHASRKSPQPF